jgi:transposase
MDREDARKLSPDAQHERRRQVVRAYKRGVNRRQIAREFGLSYSSVRITAVRFKLAMSPARSVSSMTYSEFRVSTI